MIKTPDYKRRGNQISLGRRWTYTELGILKELAATTPPKLIARQLNRSYESVRRMAYQCRVSFREERKKAG